MSNRLLGRNLGSIESQGSLGYHHGIIILESSSARIFEMTQQNQPPKVEEDYDRDAVPQAADFCFKGGCRSKGPQAFNGERPLPSCVLKGRVLFIGPLGGASEAASCHQSEPALAGALPDGAAQAGPGFGGTLAGCRLLPAGILIREGPAGGSGFLKPGLNQRPRSPLPRAPLAARLRQLQAPRIPALRARTLGLCSHCAK
jgi:hypothetical protein